jgi:dienelactone hydrolase
MISWKVRYAEGAARKGKKIIHTGFCWGIPRKEVT